MRGAAKHVKGIQKFQIFVNNLPWTVCKETLAKHFSKYGKVKSIKYDLDRNTGFYKPFAFINMMDRQGFNSALQSDTHVIDNSNCLVKSNRKDDWWQEPEKS